ncbi:5-(carboxyamino)imidazole ribonucleotide synthase [Brevibacillus sp. B_LB10_24]|uniref:5-(carboxyamino)imidazole ribonucleotide synthase n=1 Tax=Brevibacillus sp. B_LB10_24 TaxID=3380645 RepID=UPI0038B97B35
MSTHRSNKHADRIVKPGKTIGLLGGGQLGRMIALAGRAMGYRFVTLDPTPDSPSGQVSDRQIVAAFDDIKGAEQLAQACDLITYEFENVDAAVAEVLESTSFVPQGSRLLSITQNRITEKSTIQSLGIPVAPFRVVASQEDLQEAAAELGLPCVMKTATGGYDGKGQRVLRDESELAEAFAALSQPGVQLIVEKYIPFVKELSVIAARSSSGECAAFPAAENIHRENILHMSIVPARISPQVTERAEKIARQIAEELDVIGLIAVEMFLTADDQLYVNELAPRPHNSGHYSMDACVTSQFEQHLRAVCNLPLGSVKLLSPVVMVNLLGGDVEKIAEKLEQLSPACKLHLYGKHESKPKRKMGHINVLADTVEGALCIINDLGIWEKVEG